MSLVVCHDFVHDEKQLEQVRDLFMLPSQAVNPVFALSMAYRRSKIPESERICEDSSMMKHFTLVPEVSLARQVRQCTTIPVEFAFDSPIPTNQLALYFHANHASKSRCTLQQLEQGFRVTHEILTSTLSRKVPDLNAIKLSPLVQCISNEPNPWFHFEIDQKPAEDLLTQIQKLVPGQLVIVESYHGFHVLFPKVTLSANPRLYNALNEALFKKKLASVVKSNMFPLPGTYMRGFPAKFYLVRNA